MSYILVESGNLIKIVTNNTSIDYRENVIILDDLEFSTSKENVDLFADHVFLLSDDKLDKYKFAI